ncbi:hypothetical protein BGX38DRAFT_1173504 [Terfezia claveryi]|nr:hypothetical protein BGX38DRAFT_1173504 [Terfezia claveryi]
MCSGFCRLDKSQPALLPNESCRPRSSVRLLIPFDLRMSSKNPHQGFFWRLLLVRDAGISHFKAEGSVYAGSARKHAKKKRFCEW